MTDWQDELAQLMSELPERHVTAIDCRFGLTNSKTGTYREVGKRLSVTRERARQITGQALRFLRRSKFRDRLNGIREELSSDSISPWEPAAVIPTVLEPFSFHPPIPPPVGRRWRSHRPSDFKAPLSDFQKWFNRGVSQKQRFQEVPARTIAELKCRIPEIAGIPCTRVGQTWKCLDGYNRRWLMRSRNLLGRLRRKLLSLGFEEASQSCFSVQVGSLQRTVRLFDHLWDENFIWICTERKP